MTSEPCATRDVGFTLIELLVVLALLGLLTSLTTVALRSAAQGWEDTVRSDAGSEELRSISDLLRRLIAQAHPTRMGDASKSVVRFTGEPNRLQFLAPLAERFGARDIVIYDLRFTEDGALHIAWRLDRPSDGPTTGVDEVIQGLSEATFSFYGQNVDNGSSGWSDSWTSRTSLPKLVRASFKLRGHITELVIAPRLDAAPCPSSGSDAECIERASAD